MASQLATGGIGLELIKTEATSIAHRRILACSSTENRPARSQLIVSTLELRSCIARSTLSHDTHRIGCATRGRDQTMPTRSPSPLWYKDAVFYQLHVKSFADSNGDGIGDFPGLTTKLDHIASLGVDCLWIQPMYPSPFKDDGY